MDKEAEKAVSMRHFVLTGLVVLFASLVPAGDEEYKLGPDSMRQEGVPKGTVIKDRRINDCRIVAFRSAKAAYFRGAKGDTN
jgi:hypothetical protein